MVCQVMNVGRANYYKNTDMKVEIIIASINVSEKNIVHSCAYILVLHSLTRTISFFLKELFNQTQ